MPRYFYTCTECDHKISIYHSMSEEMTDCVECAATSSLKKIPSFFNSDKKQEPNSKKGDVVKKSINDFKEELEEEKNRLKGSFYEPNK